MSQRAHSRGLLVIAAFKLLKGLGLLAVGIGAHTLMHRDLAVVMEHWVDVFRIDPNNHYLHTALERVTNLDARRLRELSIGTFFYAALLLTEGVGLAFGQRWAEYFTIIATSSFIPLEIYEIVHHTTVMKIVLLLINVVVVAYLVWELRRYREVKAPI
jgi:uncharacterized membrane protein (DUF2068 family)